MVLWQNLDYLLNPPSLEICAEILCLKQNTFFAIPKDNSMPAMIFLHVCDKIWDFIFYKFVFFHFCWAILIDILHWPSFASNAKSIEEKKWKNTRNAFPIVLWGNLDYLSDYLLPLSRAPPAQHFYHSSDPNSVPNNKTKVLHGCKVALFHHEWFLEAFLPLSLLQWEWGSFVP